MTEKSKPVGGVRVHKSNVDKVFMATALEKEGLLGKKQSSDLQHPARKERIKHQAEEIVKKGKARVEKEEKKRGKK